MQLTDATVWGGLMLLLAGCGDYGISRPSDAAAESEETSDSSRSVAPAGVTVSVTSPGRSGTPPDGRMAAERVAETAADDAARLLEEIRETQRRPLPGDPRDAKKTSRTRNLEAVEKSARVLRLTVGRAGRSDQFLEAVRHLLESRFRLAINGTDADVDQLYADVRALNDHDPESEQAAVGIYYLAKFAHTKARLAGPNEVIWFENFSRWAREFAERFPNQQDRAVTLLFGAGRSCEVHSMSADSESDRSRLMTEAKLCYTLLAKEFFRTSQGQEAAAVLRRLALPGKKLSQFAGPTLNGRYLNAEDLAGHITVIYFWDLENGEFHRELLPVLKQAFEHSNDRLRLVGVNLDEDENAVRDFVDGNEIPGEQIFFSMDHQRGWNSPLIRFWGISRTPAVWLVDRSGIVSAVDVSADQLSGKIGVLIEMDG